MEPRSLSEALRHLFCRVLFAGQAATETRIRLVSLAIVLALPAVILYPTLGFHLLEPDEGRYAQIPKEMLVHHSWIVPTLQGEPYLDKPPLLYWLVALSLSGVRHHAGSGAARPGDLRPPDDPRGLPDWAKEHWRAGCVLGRALPEYRAGVRRRWRGYSYSMVC